MKIRTQLPLRDPTTRVAIPEGTELDVSDQDVFWFRRVEDGDAKLVEAEPAPRATRRESKE